MGFLCYNQKEAFIGNFMKQGFTLVELLVVVLIIGILAAMAMPHYEKAVWQSRNTQLKMAARNIARAEQLYLTRMGKLPTSFNSLSFSLPLKVKKTNGGPGANPCQITAKKGEGILEGENFVVILNNTATTDGVSVAVWTEGKYKCNGFAWTARNQYSRCWEARNGTSTIEDGEFCEELESATYDTTAGGWARYIMP